MKYYTNLFKIVGKSACFIIGSNSREQRDKVVKECSQYIFSFRKNKKKRESLIGRKEKIDTHIDVEIVCSEWQGEKLVYVLEVTKSIISNKDNQKDRKNGKLLFKLFKRYSNIEEFHKSITSSFSGFEFPGIPPKTVLKGSKTEVIDRRMLNFELFFQTIMLYDNFVSYFKTRSFMKFDYKFENDERTEKVNIHF